MMRCKIAFVCLFFIATFLVSFPVHAQSSSPQDTLNQYISDLQKNPNDYALREKIIKHVQTMRPLPAIPEEARRHYVMALTLFKGAKKIEDYGESIEEFKSGLLIAPWWAEANRDLGMALEAAQRYDEAISALKLYIASGLGEEKARAAQDEIYKIEGMKKLAAREKAESSPQAVAAPAPNSFEALLGKIAGRRYSDSTQRSGPRTLLDVSGKVLIWGQIGTDNRYYEDLRTEITGRETTVKPRNPYAFWASDTFIISEDGGRITQHRVLNNGNVTDRIYLWER